MLRKMLLRMFQSQTTEMLSKPPSYGGYNHVLFTNYVKVLKSPPCLTSPAGAFGSCATKRSPCTNSRAASLGFPSWASLLGIINREALNILHLLIRGLANHKWVTSACESSTWLSRIISKRSKHHQISPLSTAPGCCFRP